MLSRRVSKSSIGLDQVDNTSDATKNSASVTLTNKTIDLANNTLTGTTAQFNTALSDGDFATLAGSETLTNKTLTSPVLNTGVSGTAVATAASASTLALRDSNANLSADAFMPGFTTTATAAGTTTLTVGSTQIQEFTGSTTQTVTLPTTSVPAGMQFTIVNNSTGIVTVQSSGANTVSSLAGGTTATFTALIATPTTAAHWDSTYVAIGGDASTNTSTSVDNEVALFSGTGGKTIKRATGSGLAVVTAGVLSTVTAPSGTVVGTSDTQTLTNKRVQPRVTTVTSSATPTFNTDTCDLLDITALATNITSMSASGDSPAGNMTGTPTNGQKLMVRIKDNGTIRTITWGPKFQSSGVATLLATTVASKEHHVLLMYSAGVSKWVCIAVDATGY